MTRARRLLVLRFSSAGDIVLTFPALAALKAVWPDCEIFYATKKRFAPLVTACPHVSEVISLEPHESALHFAKRLRPLGCDTLIDLHGKLRSHALSLLLRGTRRIRAPKRSALYSLAVRLMLTPFRPNMMMATRFHRAIERLVGHTLPEGELRYVVSDSVQAEADRLLIEAGVDLQKPILGMAPGANWETKRWPVERYAQLAARAEARGLQIVLSGNPDEQALCQRVQDDVPSAKSLAQELSLEALAGFINRCTAFVGNDSGPMHVARALGVPTLAIFGSTSPFQFDFAGHALLFANVTCSPCHFYGRRRCPNHNNFRCMLDLDVEQAWRKLEPLLDGKRRPFVRG